MEVLFMDKQYNTTKIVDSFISCIWNEQYIGYGDFELYFPMDYGALTGIQIGYYASIRESDRYMVVDAISITTSVEEGNLLTITGRSLESFLEYRIVRNDVILKGNLQSAIQRILNSNAIAPTQSNRILPGLSFSPSNDPAVTKLTIDFELKAGDNLYDAIYVICESYHLGFRVVPTEDGKMEFSLYAGKDHSYAQEANPWIVFSPKFENIKESEMYIDTTTQKTVVIGEQSYLHQNADGTETEKLMSVEIGQENYGFARKEIYKQVSVSVESVDKEQFGKPQDRVNIREFQSWEPIYFDSAAYREDYNKWSDKLSSRRPEIKEERTEWRQVEKEGSNEPGWQEAHPNENPNIWVSVTIPGDDAATIARKQHLYNSILEQEPKESDYTRYGWVLTDHAGYQAALDKAQQEIDKEFDDAVNDKVNSAKATMTNECQAELQKHTGITKFTGELDSNVQSSFGVDYFLGDIVQFVNEFNYQAVTRVISITYSQDSQNGYVANPTFQSDDEAVFDI